jgi:hypothetical protein
MLRLEVDLIHIAEALLQEEDPLAVVREIGPLAEEGQPSDVGREVAVGRRRRSIAAREAVARPKVKAALRASRAIIGSSEFVGPVGDGLIP